jgi:hypothetical protein
MDPFPEKVFPGGYERQVVETAMRLLEQEDDTERYLDLAALKNENPVFSLAVIFKMDELRQIQNIYEESIKNMFGGRNGKTSLCGSGLDS